MDPFRPTEIIGEPTPIAKQGEPLCPFGDGRHKRQPWAVEGRSGLVCMRCSKTWEWVGKELVATWDLMKQKGVI
jgi:hypothetical protein